MIWVCHVWKLKVEDEKEILIFDTNNPELITTYCKKHDFWIEKIEPLKIISLSITELNKK